MTTFASAPAALPRVAPLDPTKHVNYTLGMVLGVEDFVQEFAYLSGRDRWLARELSGYGTVWGLRVSIEVEADGPRVNVSPGVGVTPCGHLVCVTPAQCAYLNDWLAAHAEEARTLLGASPPGTLTLHVVLCYRECPTDDLPIPGEPCRSEDTLTAPSRLKDDFRLELRTERPPQREEDAIRDVVAWLRAVPVTDGPGSELAELLDALRTAASDAVGELLSPPASPPSPPDGPYDFVLGAPPLGLAIPAAELTEYLRAAFSLWVTELRPALRHALPGCDCGCGCSGGGTCGCGCDGSTGAPGEPCDEDVLYLATIDVPVNLELLAEESGWTIDDTRRPYLLHTRFIQEWLLTEGGAPAEESPPILSPPGPPIEDVTAHQVVGPPTADWDETTGILDLGIPAGADGAGITSVVISPLPAGSPPTVISLINGVLTLGMGPGAAGTGITSVVISPQPAGSQPSVISLINGVLTLGMGPGAQGAAGDQFVVAAGRFGPQGGHRWATPPNAPNTPVNFTATPVPGLAHVFHFRFPNYRPEGNYLIKGTPIIGTEGNRLDPLLHTFEVIDDKLVTPLLANLNPPPPAEFTTNTGFFARVMGERQSGTAGFYVEVSEYPRAN